MLQNLNDLAKKQPIDTDYLVSQTPTHTHLLLRLGENCDYPEEVHHTANEYILVLEGRCRIEIAEKVYTAVQGEMITVTQSMVHRFLPESDCLLSVNFVSTKEHP
jgi:mannose-6-phosphate isomerase-like protein (cupin superfamily)